MFNIPPMQMHNDVEVAIKMENNVKWKLLTENSVTGFWVVVSAE